MEVIKKKLTSTKRGLKEFHTKKPHIEFFTALLTVPVLLTVIILNVNNLRNENKDKETEKEPEKSQTIVITQPANNNTETKEVVVTKEACEPGIGEISIAFPEEGENVKDNPVDVDIDYDAGDYCEVVWSYRINGGNWSSYDDRSIALYNLPNGEIKFDLRVKSVVNSDTENLTRTFSYSGAPVTSTPTPTVSPTPVQ